jgi:hypothetical protein
MSRKARRAFAMDSDAWANESARREQAAGGFKSAGFPAARPDPRPDLDRLRDVEVLDKLPIGPGQRESGTHPTNLPRYANMGDVAAYLIIRDLSAADPLRIRGLPGSPGVAECRFCAMIESPRNGSDEPHVNHLANCLWLRARVLSDTWDGIA